MRRHRCHRWCTSPTTLPAPSCGRAGNSREPGGACSGQVQGGPTGRRRRVGSFLWLQLVLQAYANSDIDPQHSTTPHRTASDWGPEGLEGQQVECTSHAVQGALQTRGRRSTGSSPKQYQALPHLNEDAGVDEVHGAAHAEDDLACRLQTRKRGQAGATDRVSQGHSLCPKDHTTCSQGPVRPGRPGHHEPATENLASGSLWPGKWAGRG